MGFCGFFFCFLVFLFFFSAAADSSLTPGFRSGNALGGRPSPAEPAVPNWEEMGKEEAAAEGGGGGGEGCCAASLIPHPRGTLRSVQFSTGLRLREGKILKGGEEARGGDAPGSHGRGRKVRKSGDGGDGCVAGRWRGTPGITPRAFPVEASPRRLRRTLENTIFELTMQIKGFFPPPLPTPRGENPFNPGAKLQSSSAKSK